MKGIIFNLLEEVVSSHHGEAAWETLLEKAGVDGVYTSLGSYPDSEIETLVATAGTMLGIPREECLRWFGCEAMPLLSQRFPAFFKNHRTTIPFVVSVNDIIHPEVRKIHPDAHCPTFRFEHTADGALQMGYKSPRQMCALAQGFIEGAAHYFNEQAHVEHLRCTAKGDAECLLSVRAEPLEKANAA